MDYKSVAIILFTLGSSSVLWLLSLGQVNEFSFQGFVGFFTMVFGGSLTFHFLNILYQTPFTQNNKLHWFDLKVVFIKLIFWCLISFICILAGREIGGNGAWLIVFGVVAYLVAFIYYIPKMAAEFSKFSLTKVST